MRKISRLLLATGICVLLSINPVLFACDSDAECGPGGTCIKREKRARGVCYGGVGNPTAAEKSQVSPGKAVISSPVEQPMNPPLNGDAPVFGEEGYVEPSAPPRLIDRLDVPTRTSGSCISNTDCTGGQECVYRDPMLGHGSCELPPNN